MAQNGDADFLPVPAHEKIPTEMVGIASEGVVLVVVFGEIQGLGFLGDALDGIVAEPAALTVRGLDTLLGAQDRIVVQLRATAAVGAGTLHLLSEKHSCYLA